MSSEALHESKSRLRPETIDRHRAIFSLMEHASMVLEWLRRHDPVLDGHLRTYLFSSRSIVGIEAEVEESDANRPNGTTGLDVEALRDKEAL